MKSSMAITRRLVSALVAFGLFVGFSLIKTHGQQAPAAAQKQTTGTAAVNLTAKSANVSESGSAVRINILRWSTDEERNPVVAAMNPNTPAPAAAAGGRGGAGRGGRGGAAQADAGGATQPDRDAA